jgi:multimeric flavodoxin WrbA
MKVLAILGTNRKNGTIDRLTNSLLEGCKKEDVLIEKKSIRLQNRKLQGIPGLRSNRRYPRQKIHPDISDDRSFPRIIIFR